MGGWRPAVLRVVPFYPACAVEKYIQILISNVPSIHVYVNCDL